MGMHKEYRKIYPEADTAILFIHGILGTPDHFSPFLPLVPAAVSVYNLLLDGHGMSVQDFSHTSMEKWEAQVHEAVETLSQSHDNIFIVAHSMGTLLALGEAAHPKVRELFLLALPIQLGVRPRLLANIFKVYFNRISPTDGAAVAARDACSITLTKNLFAYIGWIPRYLELFQKILKTRRLLPSLSIPCQVYQSAHDEMVSPSSVPYLLNHTDFSVSLLENSEHYRYGEHDLKLLQLHFQLLAQQACGNSNK